ncbi:MAG: hypothetical protein COB76_00265 [Alphaproteobacteria bacterium]|nr:MAG: hypothetical protein COB76_00265 [Alphaproteobacteria bacterium]
MNTRTHTRTQGGFSLLEMLLTVMIVSGLLVAVFNLLEEYAEKQLAESTAEYMENIALAVEDILVDPILFQQAYALADARPSDVLELSLNDLTSGFDGIPASTRLNENIRNRTPMGSEIDVILRIADNPAIDTDAQAMEIIVATRTPIIDERARRAAIAAGPYGGLLRDDNAPIESSFASWAVNLADLAGTAWVAAVAAEPPVENETAYLIHYRHMSFEESAGDYMFRISIPGRPELNRMFTNLNMGTHNIMGTDNFDIGGDLTLEGRALVNGDMRVVGATRINEGTVTAGQRIRSGSMTVNGTGGGVTGHLTVDDSVNISRLNISGQLNANTAELRQGLDTTNQVTVEDLQLLSGVASAGSVNATRLQGSGGSPNITVQGQINASNLTTNILAVQGGNVGTLDTIAAGDVIIGGELRAQNIGLGDANISTFGACDRGC